MLHRPRLVIAGVECTPWCWFNVAVNYKHRPEQLQAMQQRSLVFLRMCFEFFRQQLEHGDEMFLENPDHSSLFKHRLAQKILRLRVRYKGRIRSVHYRTACMCRFGKKNSVGRPIKKRLGLIVTDGLLEAFREDLCCCVCEPGANDVVKGKETRMSMAYPDDFVDHILGHVLNLKVGRECLMVTTDCDHSICENFVCAVGFADACREEINAARLEAHFSARVESRNAAPSPGTSHLLPGSSPRPERGRRSTRSARPSTSSSRRGMRAPASAAS